MRHQTTDRRPGAAAVELAVLLPFLAFVAVITTDWARIMHHSVALDDATRAAALYACDTVAQRRSPSDPLVFSGGQSSLLTGTQNAARAECPTLSPPVAVTSVAQSTDAAGVQWVTVTATVRFTPLVSYPGVSPAETLVRSVRMRVIPVTTN